VRSSFRGLTWIMAGAGPGSDPCAMDARPRPAASPLSPGLLAAAPHRLLFLVGSLNVLAAMAWWALWLVALRWQPWSLPQPPVPAGWGHGFVMGYQVLTPFMFGFLLTVFPRWLALPALAPRHYLPVGLGLFGGQLLVLAGLLGYPPLLHLGVLATIAAWIAGLWLLVGLLRQARSPDWHARSCVLALALGLAGLLCFAAWLHLPARGLLGFAALKIAVIGFLLPVFLTVAHRMLPFFAGAAVPGYRPWRPLWLLAAFWLLLLLHLALELGHAYAWLWLPDLPLTALATLMLVRQWPHGPMPGLLRVLFLGLCWLPMAFALYSAQGLVMAATGQFVLGRAPVHALTVGLFGSLLVAMVTRVSQGHSGRPLAMPAVAWFAFVGVQLAALARIGAELAADAWAWQAWAALAWLLAFLPWVLRHARIYLSPRVDGARG
jgi:uncharacterized protein involved in response to NO